ncbi:Cys/Met metabolism PLP-dependent enzyme [Halorubrum aquaticum]|uniref:Cys/Met metabolism PLP-dependent enzyme n=1 Tax=Halorubrum aquaticum TaxID=387340 RepID=A0A1I2Z2X5_9EURY|nr:PLP-dependent transferase [Halorubrum aquaticum]SFH31975.1 Cys/Met metabolism PLP-dependent enzyme [Halorubrum aquaticum]
MTDERAGERGPGPDRDRSFETREVHASARNDQYGALATPIYANSTYEYDTMDGPRGGHRYSRISGPTREDLEGAFADLEGASHAAAFASGMAAIDAVCSLLTGGDHVVVGESVYAETHELLTRVYAGYGIETTVVDSTDPGAIADAMREETAMVYAETPTNPTLRIVDIEATAGVVDDHPGDPLLVVDNTFASPYLQRPLERGADLVVESLTKYVGGHSDVVAGAVATREDDLAEEIAYYQYARGGTPGPFACFLALRGIKTLSARMERHCRNATAVAALLDGHDAVERAYYPGLESHPNHAVAREQMADFGGMVSAEFAGGREAAAAFAADLDVFVLAESLGGVESLAEHPATMTHQDFSREELERAGIPPGLVRLSVGTEHREDLLRDVEDSLDGLTS